MYKLNYLLNKFIKNKYKAMNILNNLLNKLIKNKYKAMYKLNNLLNKLIKNKYKRLNILNNLLRPVFLKIKKAPMRELPRKKGNPCSEYEKQGK